MKVVEAGMLDPQFANEDHSVRHHRAASFELELASGISTKADQGRSRSPVVKWYVQLLAHGIE